ncbi:hypothetical protein G9P44_005742 [Scheffersomyces stipitis]|nr:hypothetical protein G9P44_005742 [Scheffersomyces stipitis]
MAESGSSKEPSPSSIPPEVVAPRKNVRSKYSRPCDACSLRKVKCDLKQPSCTRCLEHGLPCTNNRVRKKCGPKHIHSKTRESILEMSGSSVSNSSSGTTPSYESARSYRADDIAGTSGGSASALLAQRYYVPLISLKHLLPCLQVYQTWFYGVWPVVSVAYLMSKVVSTPGAGFSTDFNEDNLSAYSLSCAVSAAIIVQVTFLSSSSAKMMNLPEDVKHSTYANEAIRARDAINYRLHPSPETLLTSFFLHAYYINIKGGAPAAIVYLREAISIAQILGLHNSNTFIGKSLAEVHRLRKIYYLLLVTERFICIEDDIPVILEPSIPFPSLEDEEYSSLLTGFTELVKVFAIPDKKFFDKFMTLKMNENEYASFPSQTWIINVQQQLESIRVLSETLSIQKLNILLSKYWMKSLTWNISRKNNLLLSKASTDNTNSSLSTDYPFVMAKDFLSESKDLPLFAFESNGPGVCIKLLELGNSLADSISLTRDYSGFEYLSSIFALVSKLKNDITLPLHLYQKIENMLISSKFVTTTLTNYPTTQDEQSEQVESELFTSEAAGKIDTHSPFTQMAMAFCITPQVSSTVNEEIAAVPSPDTDLHSRQRMNFDADIVLPRDPEKYIQNNWF